MAPPKRLLKKLPLKEPTTFFCSQLQFQMQTSSESFKLYDYFQAPQKFGAY